MAFTGANDYWARVNVLWERLKDDILWSTLKDGLAPVLSREDEQRIDAEVVDADKFRKLVSILKAKPPDQKTHEILHTCLKTSQPHLAEELENTTLAEKPALDADKGQSLEAVARSLLATNYEYADKKTVNTTQVQSLLHREMERLKLPYDWDIPKLGQFLKEVFSPHIIIEGKGNKRRFKNLTARKEGTAKPTTSLPTRSQSTEEGEQGMPIQTSVLGMSPSEMRTYIEPFFKSIGIHGALDVFEKEDIDGEIFLSLSLADLEKLFPEVTFGKRRKIELHIGKLKQEAEASEETKKAAENEFDVSRAPCVQSLDAGQSYHEVARKFDRGARATDTYAQGRLLPLGTESRGHFLQPIRRFVLLEQGASTSPAQERDVETEVAIRTLRFAAALLNERRNGTIHFGVSPEDSDKYKAGEIVGLKIDEKKCVQTLQKLIEKGFYEDQTETANAAIRSPQFIQVTHPEKKGLHLHVVEVDIVPSSRLVRDEAFFLRSDVMSKKKSKKKPPLLYRLAQGEPKSLDGEQLMQFMKIKGNLTAQRERQESSDFVGNSDENPCQTFRNLFAGGHDTLDDDVYPVVFLSPLDSEMDMEYIQKNLSFIKHLDAHCVFDFDPASDKKGLYKYMEEQEQVLRVLITDNFDKRRHKTTEKKAAYDTMLSSLQTSSQRSWVFCNGYSVMDVPEMPISEWKKARSVAFRDALEYFHSEIPDGRGLVVFFLFSKNYEAIIEVANETILKFEEQYMVVAETEAIAACWKERMKAQQWSESDIDKRCVIGMPWKEVNDTIIQILQPEMRSSMAIPTSTGATCQLREKTKNDLSDLEILCTNECDNCNDYKDPRQREKKRQEVEAEYFRGGEASWWNYSFGNDHVLERDKHTNIKSAVVKALKEGDPEDRVNVVLLQHQPGAGGTTSAKQVLWDLKDTYRCCVVRKITDQTCDQIVQLRQYEEKGNPKPCLVLIDNPNEENLRQLRRELEVKASSAARVSEDPIKVFCVLLVCTRRANLPPQVDTKTIQLRQELSDAELRRFKKKSESLEKRFREDRKVDPRFLISFNILKENFSLDYIRRTVREILKEIKDVREYNLIKFLALLNAYDLDFHSVPLSCFDPVMTREDPSGERMVLSFGLVTPALKRQTGWECRMSSSLRILLNQSSQRLHGSQVRSLRLINPLLSREILLIIREDRQESISCILRDLLSSDIFSVTNTSTGLLMSVIKNIVIRRDLKKNSRLEDFSPIVIDVRDHEDVDAAATMLELVHEKTDDAFVAQQTARFFIHALNWDQARHYALAATEKAPSNSFLMDTLGQVYKQQVAQKLRQARETGRRYSNQEALEIVELARTAIDNFRQEQSMSKAVHSSATNNCGYFGELRVILILLNLFPSFDCYVNEADLHRYLAEADYFPSTYSFLKKNEELMKSLREDSLKAFRTLEDSFTQLRDDKQDDFKRREKNMDREILIKLKENLDVYFGEESNTVPTGIRPQDACEYRRRRAFRLGATSFGSLRAKFDRSNTASIKSFMEENMKTKFTTVYDIVTYLNAVILLNAFFPEEVRDVNIKDLMALSVKLYEMGRENDENYLECFLYLVLFNFPTPPRKGLSTCQTSVVPEAIKLWKNAFDRKYPRFKEEDCWQKKKDTTFFFLGNGKGLQEVIYYEELDGFNGMKIMRDESFWRITKALTRLRRFQGVLQRGGMEIHLPVETSGGNQYHLAIASSVPVKSSIWQKRVFFVLGMCWTGPKAFDVTEADPTRDLEVPSADVATAGAPPVHKKPASLSSLQRSPTLDSLIDKWNTINKGL